MEKIGGGESGASSGDVLSGDAASARGGAGEMMFPKSGSTEQVQEWFKLGNFSKYASSFEELNGHEAFGLTESQIQTGISNQLRGSALFNAIHKHDRAATTGTAATDRKRGLEGEDDETSKRSRPAHVFTSTLNVSDLVDSVDDVQPWLVADDAPPFVASEHWIEQCCADIRNGLEQLEGEGRVAPLALVRCSRGGKTRALKEIQAHLCETKPHVPRVPGIFVSFNEFSTIRDWESDDIVMALCQRIAYSAHKNRETLDYDKDFRSTKVEPNQITKWLGSNPCVLLIDELNMGFANVNTEGRRALGDFLKTNFLKSSGRYFVFSSHEISTNRQLVDFFGDSQTSERGVVVKQLPLVPILEEARLAFQWPELSARKALFRGRIPSLIACTQRTMPFHKRDKVISDLEPQWTEVMVVRLLRSFMTGSSSLVPSQLLVLMNVTDEAKVTWIPFHMVPVLQSCRQQLSAASNLPMDLDLSVGVLLELLGAFENSKTSCGDGWEGLWGVALIIRVLTRQEHALLPIPPLDRCTFSYNKYWKPSDTSPPFPDVQKVEDFVAGLQPPPSFPHVAVYYPPHASFAVYDLIVVFWNKDEKRFLYGYQFKEGKEIPKAHGKDEFEMSYVVRGDAAKREAALRNWTVASDDDIDSFLGDSGKILAPKHWRAMK